MPSNDERREIAARLRNFESLREQLRASPTCAFIDARRTKGYLDWKELCDRLADLIEPEERTCRMEYNERKRGVYCSNCGERMDMYICDQYGDGTTAYSYPFCCECGARVTE